MKRRIIERNIVYDELLTQIKGLIDIEIGDYCHSKGARLFYEDCYPDCLNIYLDNLDTYDEPIYCKYQIAHYHREDMLYLIINWKNEKEAMLKRIQGFIKAK